VVERGQNDFLPRISRGWKNEAFFVNEPIAVPSQDSPSVNDNNNNNTTTSIASESNGQQGSHCIKMTALRRNCLFDKFMY